MKIFYFVLIIFGFAANAHAADDMSSTTRLPGSVQPGAIDSMVRGPNDSQPGSLGSMQRTGVDHPDPMLNTDMGTPPSDAATSTQYNTGTDPMLNTAAPVPPSAISTTHMKAKDPMLDTNAQTPPSAAATSTVPPGVDPKFCDALVKHTPRADVTYQPGVDANGKAVAPADVPGQQQIQLPQKIEIPLTISMAKALNLDTTTYPYNQLGTGTEAWLGTLAVEGNNVTFNGKPLSGADQDNLAVLCMKQSK